MDAIVVSHSTALYAMRRSRRRYAGLPWGRLDRLQQQRALDACAPNGSSVDLDDLEHLGVWDPGLGCLDVLVDTGNARRRIDPLRPHVLSGPLPSNSLLQISAEVYTVSPALAVAQFAEDHDWREVLGLILELCGTFSLPESPSENQRMDRTEQLRDDLYENARNSRIGYFSCEPALEMRQLNRYLSYASGIRGLPSARKAARYALDGAASPMEAIMAAMFHVPMGSGGFNIKDMQLNHRMEFGHDAVLASGMPYAVLDAYIAAAAAALEYNGHYHDATRSRIHDERRTTGLQAMGILTIPVNDEQLRNIDALEAIARILYRRMGRQFRYYASGYRTKQSDLLNALRGQMGLNPC